MFLYNVPISNATSITRAVIGNFSGTKQQEIAVIRAESLLELLAIDTQTGKVNTLLTQDAFGVIRAIMPFRMTGSSKDSGRIVVLEYDPEKNGWNKLHQETYGKTGCRRYVPGQFLTADPRGRAVMIGACERQKFVYVINRDSNAQMTISSPLEAHKSHTIVYDVVGVDVGFENPIFACLEMDIQEIDEDSTGEAVKAANKVLTYYELDLGLNHVVRKWCEPVDRHSNRLIALPGGVDGPGGVLVCSENWLTWKNQNYNDVRVAIPRRSRLTLESRGILISSFYIHRMKKTFFILVQSEEGDLFKLSVNYKDDQVTELKIQYYDTVPLSSAICILKSGFLFVPADFGNHVLYQIESLGEDGGEGEFSSNDIDPDDQDARYKFDLHPLQHLSAVNEMENLSPVIDAKIYNLIDDDSPQIFALCGRGPRSTFRIMRRGLEVSELVSYPLPGSPTAVWTLRAKSSDAYDSYIVISFINGTLVLSVGETVEEVTDSGFLTATASLNFAQIGENALIQIHPHGLRLVQADRHINEWKAPEEHYIVHSCVNNRQVAIALSNGEIVYFEMDNFGQLNEFQERREITAQVYCLAVGPIPEGRQRSPYLAVGCGDQTIRILSLDPETCLEPLGMQVLDALPSYLLINEMIDYGSDTLHSTLYLHVGLHTGVLLRTTLDAVTGALSDTRVRYLGPKAVKLFEIQVQGSNCVLALTNRPWLNYTYQNRFRSSPLTYEMLEHADSFISEQCPEGIVAIAENTLRILTVDRIDNEFNTSTVNLRCTPRQCVLEPKSRQFVIVEADHAVRLPTAAEMDYDEELPPEQFGFPRAAPGQWASCIRVVNPFESETTQLLQMENNEAALVVTTCVFHSDPSTTYVIVGSAKDLILKPRTCAVGYAYVFRMSPQNTLELIHKTELDDAPSAMCAFQGRLLIGLGSVVRIYDLGKKKLLRKCEAKFPFLVVGIETQGDRIVVNDVQESTSIARYILQENRFHIFCEDHKARWMTRSVMVDFHTVAGADKFGNFFINRAPKDLIEEDEQETAKSKTLSDKSFLNGAPYRFETLCHFYVSDIITSLTKTSMVVGGRDALIYLTFSGEIGVFVPLPSREDIEFFQMLEFHLRADAPPLSGREHLAYRSYFIPNRAVIDGKLIEQFILLPAEKKHKIAEELEKPINDIVRQIELVRTRIV